MPFHCASGFRPAGTFLLAVILAAALPGGLRSQEAPGGDTLPPPTGRLTLPAGVTLGIGTQIQFDAVAIQDPQEGETSGFRVENARIRFFGTLPRNLSWRLTTEFGALLDVRLSQTLPWGFALDAGVFKPPLTREYIDSRRTLDFVSRSRVVRTLVWSRDVGLVLRWAGAPLSVEASVVNGDGGVRGEGERGLMGVLRMDLLREGEGADSLRVGASFAGNGDPEAVTGEGLDRRYRAVERLASADVRWVRGPLLFSAEWTHGWTRTLEGEDPRGGHFTVGARPAENTEIHLRLDALHPGGVGNRQSRELVAGVSHRPTAELRFMANLFVPLDDGDLQVPDEGLRFVLRSQLYF